MRFVLGPIPEDTGFRPLEAGWRKHKELGAVLLLSLSVPMAFLVGLSLLWLYKSCVRPSGLPIDTDLMLLTFALLLLPHEAVHAVATPGWGRSNRTVLGFWTKRALPYAAYLGEWTRGQALWCLLAPFAVLSVVPLSVILVAGYDNPALFQFFAVNAVASSGDFLQVPMLLLGIPRGATLRNKGWQTYWRETQPSA